MQRTTNAAKLPKPIAYAGLFLLALLAVIPFVWLLSTSLKSAEENLFAFPPQWIPAQFTFQNYIDVWQQVPMVNYFINSLVVTVLTIVLNLLCSTLAAYPLARLKLPYKNLLFLIIMLTMMIPFQVLMIPLYLLCVKLGMTDQHGSVGAIIGLVLPFSVSGFGIFLMRDAFSKIPLELEQSSILDGCGTFKSLYYVMLPLLRPHLITLAIFTLISSWSEFLWPSLVLSKPQYFTLPIGLIYLQSAFSANWRVIAAGVIISLIPVVMLFVFLQRYFISANVDAAVKG